MTKRIILIIAIAIVFLILVGVAAFKNEIVYYFALQKEFVSEYEKNVFQSCRSGEEKTFTIEKNGKTYTIPLPDGAAEFSNSYYPKQEGEQQFLAINYEVWDKNGGYFEKLQNLSGYEFDQLGTLIILREKNDEIDIHILIINFARRYERLTISYS